MDRLMKLLAQTLGMSSSSSKKKRPEWCDKSVFILADCGFELGSGSGSGSGSSEQAAEQQVFGWYAVDVPWYDDGGDKKIITTLQASVYCDLIEEMLMEKNSGVVLKAFLFCGLQPLEDSSFGIIGTNLYSLGGVAPSNSHCQFPSHDVHVTDVAEPNWMLQRMMPGMLSPRESACSLVIDDKLYVFGGILQQQHCQKESSSTSPPSLGPWAEVYDPRFNVWCALPDPPVYFVDDQGFFFAAYDHSSPNKLVFLGCVDSPYLLSYDVGTNLWWIFADDFECHSHVIHPALFDNKLYWMDRTVAVYDLHLRKMFKGSRVEGYFDYDMLLHPSRLGYTPGFLHLHEDVFLYIWRSFSNAILFSRVRIWIERSGRDHSIYHPKALSLSTDYFKTDKHIYDFHATLLDNKSSFMVAVKDKMKNASKKEDKRVESAFTVIIPEVKLRHDFGQGNPNLGLKLLLG